MNESGGSPRSRLTPWAADGYELVQTAFEDVLRETGGGGAFCAYVDGVAAVDLWAGTTTTGAGWGPRTVCAGWSVSKGLTALVVQLLAEHRLVDLDTPIAEYWPQFAARGKQAICMRQVLTHTAGLPFWPGYSEIVAVGSTTGWDRNDDIADALAAAPTQWTPGLAMGYHPFTFGWLIGETVRRATGYDMKHYLRTLVEEPLGADVSFGTPNRQDVPGADFTVADLRPPVWTGTEADRRAMLLTWEPARLSGAAILAASRDSAFQISDSANSTSFKTGEVPAANAFVTAEGLARVYATLACGGISQSGEQITSADSIATHSRAWADGHDLILGVHARRGLGYALYSQADPYGRVGGTFGHAGLGGQLGLADPQFRIGLGFVSDTPVYSIQPDWRLERLITSLYFCAVRSRAPSRGVQDDALPSGQGF